MQNNTVRAMQEEAVDRGRLQVQVINYGRAVLWRTRWLILPTQEIRTVP